MRVAIHHTPGSFSDRWTDYCTKNKIDFKLVNCYANDIIAQLGDCDALMWHFYHASAKATLCAKQLIYSLQQEGKKVFPDFHTMWHFDDKLGQKYLLESMAIPAVRSYIFFDKKEAVEWLKKQNLPLVFKLRGGAGSVNVHLVKSHRQGMKFIRKAFGKGFKHDSQLSMHEIWRRYRLKKAGRMDLVKGLVRKAIPTEFSKVHGREKGYVYFQDYIPGNTHDIRVIVIGHRAFGIKRMVRKNDFRASGSGSIQYEKENFNPETIRLSFEIAEKLQTQCVALDFLIQKEKSLLLEISYGFYHPAYDDCVGYWDRNMAWHEGRFDPCAWMIEDLLA
jgi:glutathione synthase/RimK-type ligase-like ATP-grasp enzyme